MDISMVDAGMSNNAPKKSRNIVDIKMPWTKCCQHPASEMECAKLLNQHGYDFHRGPMRNLFCLLMTLALASCAILEPDHDEPEVADGQPDALVEGFQALHQNLPDQAQEYFETAIAESRPDQPTHSRALLGKAFVRMHEQAPWRDLDEAERHVRQAERQLAAVDGKESISDWILRTTASRLIAAERRIESANARLAGLEQTEADLIQAREEANRLDQLEQELATVRSEREQAEETIARLRNLIMDE
jgi:ribosomal protein S7